MQAQGLNGENLFDTMCMSPWGLKVSDSLKEHRAATWTIEHLLFTTGLRAERVGAHHKGLPTQPRFWEMNCTAADSPPSFQQCFLLTFVRSVQDPKAKAAIICSFFCLFFVFHFVGKLVRKTKRALGYNTSQDKYKYNPGVPFQHPSSHLLALRSFIILSRSWNCANNETADSQWWKLDAT